MVAEDSDTDGLMAARLGIGERTLRRWRDVPEFQERVQEHLAAYRARVLSRGFAVRERRIAALNRLARDLDQQLEADNYLAEEVKLTNAGVKVRYPVFDRPKVAEFRAALDDIAKEVGERRATVELDATQQFIAAMMEYGRGARAQ